MERVCDVGTIERVALTILLWGHLSGVFLRGHWPGKRHIRRMHCENALIPGLLFNEGKPSAHSLLATLEGSDGDDWSLLRSEHRWIVDGYNGKSESFGETKLVSLLSSHLSTYLLATVCTRRSFSCLLKNSPRSLHLHKVTFFDLVVTKRSRFKKNSMSPRLFKAAVNSNALTYYTYIDVVIHQWPSFYPSIPRDHATPQRCEM